MSGKSRRHRRKHPVRGKRRKGRLTPAVAVTPEPPVTPAEEAVSPPQSSRPSAKTTTPVALAEDRYPYIRTELRRIGILAGVMLAILIGLALVYA